MIRKKPLIVVVFLLFIGLIIIPYGIAKVQTEKNELRVVLQTDKTSYQIGEPVDISIYVENHGDEDITIVFPSTQKADFWVSEFYLWSSDKVFLTIPTSVTIPSGMQALLLNERWEQVDFSGNQVPQGSYDISGWMVQSLQYPIIYAEPVTIRIGTEINIEIHGGIGATVSITNVGPFNATDVKGDIVIKGGALGFINLSESYCVDNLEVNESISKTLHPFGFGPIKIDIIASASNAEGSNLKGRMFVIFIIVYSIIPPLSMV